MDSEMQVAINTIRNGINRVTPEMIAERRAKNKKQWEKIEALANKTLQECKGQDFTIKELEMLIYKLENMAETIKKGIIERTTLRF